MAMLGLAGCSDEPEERAPKVIEPRVQDQQAEVAEASWVGVIAGRSIALSAEVAGSVTEVPVELGDTVEAEQLLVEIEVPELAEEISIAQAQQDTAQAQVRRARVDVEDAGKRLQIEKRLIRSGSTSQEALSSARARWKRAKAELEVAQSSYDEAEALLTRLRKREDQALVRAPTAGTVAAIYVSQQATVELGAPLLRFMQNVAPKLKFAVPPGEAAGLERGVRVRAVDEQGNQMFATVAHLAPEVDSASGLLTVEAELDEGEFLPGTIVRVSPAQ